MEEELIKATGVVVDKMPNGFFKVMINNSEHIVSAAISGKMRKNQVRVMIGDSVDMELSPRDLSVGRIIYRHD